MADSTISILSLPMELLEQVLRSCPKPSLLNLRLVSKSFRRISTPFAFRTLTLKDPWHHRSSDKVKNLPDHTLAAYVRSIDIDRRLLTWPNTRRGMQGQLSTYTLNLTAEFQSIFDKCGMTLQELTIRASSDGYMVSRTGEEPLSQLCAALASVEMKSLRKLTVFVETVCDLGYLMGKGIHDHYDDVEQDDIDEETVDEAARELRDPFPELETLEVYYNGFLGHARPCCDIGAGLRTFTGRLRRLHTVRVESAYRNAFAVPSAYFPPHRNIFKFIPGSDAANRMTSLHLRGSCYIINTNRILSFLQSIPNLKYLGLNYFTISEMAYRGSFYWPATDDTTGSPNWKQVFELISANMKQLVRYDFYKLVNLVEDTDLGPRNRQGDDRDGYDGMRDEENAALNKLKAEVVKRRKELGMAAE